MNVKKVEVITAEEENSLWTQGILGSSTPKQLFDALLYQLGLNFALRAAKEHRNLR